MSNLDVNTAKKHTSLGRKLKYIIGFLLLVLLVVGGIYWKKTSNKPKEEYSQWSKPVPVRIVPVQRNNLDVEIKAIGTVVPVHTVNVQSQVSGLLQQVYFKEGQWV